MLVITKTSGPRGRPQLHSWLILCFQELRSSQPPSLFHLPLWVLFTLPQPTKSVNLVHYFLLIQSSGHVSACGRVGIA